MNPLWLKADTELLDDDDGPGLATASAPAGSSLLLRLTVSHRQPAPQQCVVAELKELSTKLHAAGGSSLALHPGASRRPTTAGGAVAAATTAAVALRFGVLLSELGRWAEAAGTMVGVRFHRLSLCVPPSKRTSVSPFRARAFLRSGDPAGGDGRGGGRTDRPLGSAAGPAHRTLRPPAPSRSRSLHPVWPRRVNFSSMEMLVAGGPSRVSALKGSENTREGSESHSSRVQALGHHNLAVVRLRLGDLAGGPSSPYPPTTPGLACCLVPTVPAYLPRSLSALLPGLCPAPMHTKAEHCGVRVGASSVSVYTVPWGCTGLELSTAAILHLDSADGSSNYRRTVRSALPAR